MSLTHAPGGRRLARIAVPTAGALVASALSVVALAPSPATAAADAPAPALRWEVSQQFDNHLSTHSYAGGATEDADGVVTFPAGDTTYDAATDVLTTSYEGTVRGAFVNAGNELYSVSFADPVLTVARDGSGELSAVVASTVTGSTTPEAARVVTARFGAGDAAWAATAERATLTATPDWEGVVTADSDQSAALGMTTGRPYGNRSWQPSHLTQLPTSLRSHFYSTNSGGADWTTKAPATIVAEVAPQVAATVTQSASEVTVVATGRGFTGVTNPGDNGVYVGIAPSGGLPDVSSQEGMDAFAAASWVPAAGLVDGGFTRTLVAQVADLTPGTDYSLYTWRAHSHSTTSQDTETPLDLDLVGELSVTGPATARYGSAPAYVVSVPGGSGVVTLSGAGAPLTATLSGGTARFALPRTLAVGTRTLSFAHDGRTVTRQLTLSKTATTVSRTHVRKATAKQAGIVLVRVRPTVAGAPAAPGTVRVTMTKGKVTRVKTARLTSGQVRVTLPKVAQGRWSVRTAYAGSANHAAATHTAALVVTRR